MFLTKCAAAGTLITLILFLCGVVTATFPITFALILAGFLIGDFLWFVGIAAGAAIVTYRNQKSTRTTRARVIR